MPKRYLRFEGAIPKEEHGGGMVMAWNIGTYSFRPSFVFERTGMFLL
jgi:hypothetical protein